MVENDEFWWTDRVANSWLAGEQSTHPRRMSAADWAPAYPSLWHVLGA